MSAELLADLVRAKALFNARRVAMALEADPNGIRIVNGEIVERLRFIAVHQALPPAFPPAGATELPGTSDRAGEGWGGDCNPGGRA